jgi:hypothetical protein
LISCSRVTPLAARDFGRGLEASGAPRSPRAYAVTRARHPRSRGSAFDEEREKNGGTLLNKINSIAACNPTYSDQLRRGYELLRTIGYE